MRLRARFQRPQHTGQGFELQIGRHTMPAVGLLGHGGPVLRGCQCLQLGGPAAVLLHATLQHVLPSSPVAPQGHGGGRIPGRCIGCGQRRRCRAGGCSHCAGPGSRRQGQAQHPGHFRVQVGDMQGLGGKAIHPRLQGQGPVFGQHTGRQGNDGHRRLGRILSKAARFQRADVLRHLVAIHLGHLQIGQHQIKGLPGKLRQGLAPARGQRKLVPRAAQHHAQQLQVLGHIVHAQNTQRRQTGGRLGKAQRRPAGQCQRQLHGKRRAGTRGALHRNAAAHQLGQLAGNGGAQPGAAKAAGGGGIGLGKGIKNALQLLGRHADTGIHDAQMQHPAGIGHAQLDVAHLGKFNGVAE